MLEVEGCRVKNGGLRVKNGGCNVRLRVKNEGDVFMGEVICLNIDEYNVCFKHQYGFRNNIWIAPIFIAEQ
jgi:hypothetical protein